MKAIDKIIFNELASRRAVVLPGVGTLGVARRAAQARGKDVTAPVNQVVFSHKEAEDAPSVVGLMESMGVERSAAEGAYKEWLQGTKDGDVITISGVGVIRKDAFAPTIELDQMLNPGRTPDKAPAQEATETRAQADSQAQKQEKVQGVAGVPVKTGAQNPTDASARKPAGVQSAQHPVAAGQRPVAAGYPSIPANAPAKKNGNRLTNILLIIVILLLIAVAVVCLGRKGCLCGGKDGGVVNADAAYDKMISEKTPQPLHVELNEEPETEAPAQDVEPVAPQAQQDAVAASKKYHLVAGSFTVASNADAMAERYARQYPELVIEKLPYAGDWTLVSVFQSDDIHEVHNALRRLSAPLDNYEMWVYRKRR